MKIYAFLQRIFYLLKIKWLIFKICNCESPPLQSLAHVHTHTPTHTMFQTVEPNLLWLLDLGGISQRLALFPPISFIFGCPCLKPCEIFLRGLSAHRVTMEIPAIPAHGVPGNPAPLLFQSQAWVGKLLLGWPLWYPELSFPRYPIHSAAPTKPPPQPRKILPPVEGWPQALLLPTPKTSTFF